MMRLDIAAHVARSLEAFEYPVNLVWHGGEPLMAGVASLVKLLFPFEPQRRAGRIRHSIQTNATLINKEWCDFFRTFDIKVGVSLDGPDWANAERVDRRNKQTFHKVITGINRLQEAGIPFGIICVVTTETVFHARQIYDFFRKLRCRSLAINIVERDGNATSPIPSQGDVLKFWEDLFDAWWQNPSIEIREFRRAIKWLQHTLKAENAPQSARPQDWTATVDVNGDVRVLSPELASVKASEYQDFIVGNILTQDLRSIFTRARQTRYVERFNVGKIECKNRCGYYSFCRGGQASNKFAETGRFDATETSYCVNAKKTLLDATIAKLIQNST